MRILHLAYTHTLRFKGDLYSEGREMKKRAGKGGVVLAIAERF